MKNEIREILGFSVTVTGVAETLAEAIAAAGSETAVLNYINSNVLAHSHFGDLRKVIVAKVEEVSGIKRGTKEHGKKTVFTESEQEYVTRVEAELGADAFKALFADVDAACAAVVVDYKPGTRGSGTGESSKPAKKWYAFVEDLKKKGNYDRFVDKHGLTAETEELLDEAVARKVKEIVTAKEKAAAEQAAAALAE